MLIMFVLLERIEGAHCLLLVCVKNAGQPVQGHSVSCNWFRTHQPCR